jgi:SulP family sulfate permease
MVRRPDAGDMSGPGQGSAWRRHLPILEWLPGYGGAALGSDLLAALIVTIMLIPQSLAYALLAGLPVEMGLYASILPLFAYALFGTSRALAVGPVAVISLMSAAAAGEVAAAGSADFIAASLLLALLSGLFLLALGLLRLGFIANFLSHPVISGFISASGILIALSQVKHLLGIKAGGQTLPELLPALAAGADQTNLIVLALGLGSTLFLFWVRRGLAPLLRRLGLAPRSAGLLAKTGPVLAVAATTLAVWGLELTAQGVPVVGAVPRGLPPLTLPAWDLALWRQLAWPAALIALVGFVESVSVAQTLAAKRRQRIRPDQELVGLGVANLASAVTGGFSVTGGFARSVVNFDAGAATPAAGAFTAIGILVATLALTPLLAFLPQATLAATIIVAVLSLVDLGALGRAWRYSKADFLAMLATILATLGIGVEIGILAGVGLSILLHLWRTSRPHMAIVGLVPGTEHFRNVKRHQVLTSAAVATLRVDESLYFPNARMLEDRVLELVAGQPALRHLVLMCPAVNHIDMSALESLEIINQRLKDAGVTFHLSEVKGPVMDRLARSHFLEQLTGEVFLSQYAALARLAPEVLAAASGATASHAA